VNVESRVLKELKPDCYSSGQAISKKLKMSRSAVWKHIVKLRERGYVIDASPRHGYRLLSRPDKLLPAEIKPLLQTGVIGASIIHFDKVGSTADEARRLIEEGAAEGTVVVAEEQTKGRGRLGRSWKAPAGQAIALSVVLYPKMAPTQVPLLSLATGLAVRSAVEEVTRESAGLALKWPNDVYLNGKKLCGVLVEMAAELDRVKWVVDSFGFNVNNSFTGTDLADKATSLAIEFGREFSRRELLVALLNRLDDMYAGIQTSSGLKAIRRNFEKVDMLKGRKVVVVTPQGKIRGTALGIDDEGRLLVREPRGKLNALFSGEATISRAEPIL